MPDIPYDDDMIAVVQLVRPGGHSSIYITDHANVQWSFLAQQCRDMADLLDARARGHNSFVRFDVDDDELNRLLDHG